MSGKKQSLKSYYADAEAKLSPTKNGQSQSDTVVAPKVWKSSKGHPTAYLVYITDKEAAHLAKMDMHGSGVDKEMHFGPNGIPSFQGDGGGAGGDGGDGGSGDSGGADTSGVDSGMGGYGDGYSGSDTSGLGADTSGVDSGMGGYGNDHTDTAPDSDTGGSGDTLFADLEKAATPLGQPVVSDDSGPRQFETRAQRLQRRAQAAGVMRSDNEADLLGFEGGAKRKGSARRVLGGF